MASLAQGQIRPWTIPSLTAQHPVVMRMNLRAYWRAWSRPHRLTAYSLAFRITWKGPFFGSGLGIETRSVWSLPRARAV